MSYLSIKYSIVIIGYVERILNYMNKNMLKLLHGKCVRNELEIFIYIFVVKFAVWRLIYIYIVGCVSTS